MTKNPTLPPQHLTCNECGCKSIARVDERKSDGSFGPGPDGRCEDCKAISVNAYAPTPQPRAMGSDE